MKVFLMPLEDFASQDIKGAAARFAHSRQYFMRHNGPHTTQTRLLRNPLLLYESLHRAITEAGFSYGLEQKSNLAKACSQGKITCEQACFIYIALLNAANIDLTSAALNDKLRIITMHAKDKSHIAFTTRDSQNNWLWDPTTRNKNQEALDFYRKHFKLFQQFRVEEALNGLLGVFKLDVIKPKISKKYLASCKVFERLKVPYPSPYFYTIILVNLAANLLSRGKLPIHEARTLCLESKQRLKSLGGCSYLDIADLGANIKWFENIEHQLH